MPSTMIMALTIGDADSIRNAGACLHSHSLNAMLVTLVFGDEFRCTHLEMIKGIKGHGYTSTLVVPIIENTPHEADLCHSMAEGAMQTSRARRPVLCPARLTLPLVQCGSNAQVSRFNSSIGAPSWRVRLG